MIEIRGVSKTAIASHYDIATLFYWLLWGRHLHHGLWQADESPALAQENLTRRFSERIHIQRGEAVLDVGCGMGGSAIHLARVHECRVTAITVSRVQRVWAAFSALCRGVKGRTRFRVADAESIDFPPETFDAVWVIECSEHLFDKPRFFQRASRWLRPGGRIGVCAWLAADEPHSEEVTRRVRDVCEGMLCPSLGTMSDYRGWMRDAGLRVTTEEDWTSRVQRTWEICLSRVRRTRMRTLAKVVDRRFEPFLDRFTSILDAYRTGAMRYGCLVGHAAGGPSTAGPAGTNSTR